MTYRLTETNGELTLEVTEMRENTHHEIVPFTIFIVKGEDKIKALLTIMGEVAEKLR